MVWMHSRCKKPKTEAKRHSLKPLEFLWFGCIPATKNPKPEQNEIDENHKNSYGLAAFPPEETQSPSTETIGIPLVWLNSSHNYATTKAMRNSLKPWEFLWFGCIPATRNPEPKQSHERIAPSEANELPGAQQSTM